MKKQKVREFVIADKLGEKERLQRSVVLFMQNRHSFMGLQGSKYFCRRHACENLREHFFFVCSQRKTIQKNLCECSGVFGFPPLLVVNGKM